MLYGETLDQKVERSNSTTHKINTRVTTVTVRRVVQLMPRLTHQSSAQLMITGTMISSCNELALLPLEHDPEKHALGPRPDGWVPVFRKDHAQKKKIERDDDSKKSHPALSYAAGATDPNTDRAANLHAGLSAVYFDKSRTKRSARIADSSAFQRDQSARACGFVRLPMAGLLGQRD